tara:strand:- start:80 stop:388 length:309 start_codon:yes stop_codon:yes gene_type:complete
MILNINKSLSNTEERILTVLSYISDGINDLKQDINLNKNNMSKTKQDKTINQNRLKILNNVNSQLKQLKTEITNIYNELSEPNITDNRQLNIIPKTKQTKLF